MGGPPPSWLPWPADPQPAPVRPWRA